MHIRLIRHATFIVRIAGKTVLIDPMFSPKETFQPTAGTVNPRMNPLIDLPCPVGELTCVDAVFVTHMHKDHWDESAAEALPKEIPVFCQPCDGEALQGAGFKNVVEVADTAEWGGIRVSRTGGRHGSGTLRLLMGTVSGYVFQSEDKTLYVAGDTVWCPEVALALERFRPDVTIVFAGEARFELGSPITMGSGDIGRILAASETKVVAGHMDAWNHCVLSRETLRKDMEAEGFSGRVFVPENGEWLTP
ncbi:MBL fold metallo-hydrolase [Paenibacillus thermotolerans]|uniref:MBL fold metallo-hydrolase n=1 Tax=Paenibacillus thermotolerans TaxID=3027807 RepID=UPI002367EB35|nr:MULTISPECIES: MBL fold metallo-hydrolase [unclassified Paenibacillus]